MGHARTYTHLHDKAKTPGKNNCYSVTVISPFKVLNGIVILTWGFGEEMQLFQ